MTDDINNSNDNSDRHHQHYPSESSPSLTDPNYLLNQGSNLDTSVERETKEPQPQSPFIKRILVVDDDPDLTLTFKALNMFTSLNMYNL